MIIRTLWIWRQDVDSPECVLAWDQGLIDELPNAWEQYKEISRLRFPLVKDESMQWREIEIQLDYNAVMKHWWPDVVDGEVKP